MAGVRTRRCRRVGRQCFETATWLMMGVTKRAGKEKWIWGPWWNFHFEIQAATYWQRSWCIRYLSLPWTWPFHRWETQQENGNIPKCQVPAATQTWDSLLAVLYKNCVSLETGSFLSVPTPLPLYEWLSLVPRHWPPVNSHNNGEGEEEAPPLAGASCQRQSQGQQCSFPGTSRAQRTLQP